MKVIYHLTYRFHLIFNNAKCFRYRDGVCGQSESADTEVAGSREPDCEGDRRTEGESQGAGSILQVVHEDLQQQRTAGAQDNACGKYKSKYCLICLYTLIGCRCNYLLDIYRGRGPNEG